MSNTPYPDDAASFSQAGSSEEEELVHKVSDDDCEVCRSLRLPDPEWIRTTSATLRRTAADGCKLCELLQRVSETACAMRNKPSPDAYLVFVKPPGSGGGPVFLNMLTHGEGQNHVNFYSKLGDSCPWPFMISWNGPDEDACIHDCVQPISRMLDTCNKNHTTCKASDLQHMSKGLQTFQFIPKRLLRISTDGVSFQVLLVETAACNVSLDGEDLRYTALSHCWGSIPIIKTTTETVSGFRTEGINWENLPKTFQEALILTCELGINYAWIDSLCILQDSVDDWAHQASQMAEIFSNAYLTIAASASQNGHQGLLNRRRRSTQKLEAVHDQQPFAVYVHDTITHDFHDTKDMPFVHPNDLPLRDRAWCLQEELLSIRMVHFVQDEVVFVCRAATTCECDHIWQARFQVPPITGTSSLDPRELWANIIRHYTTRGISFPKDRLPALSSLTYLFEEDPDHYLAGLWKSHLPGSLLWWTGCGKRPEQEQNSQCRPPSWSWASIEGRMSYQVFEEYQDIAEVLNASIYPTTVDPRGMVLGGQITLRAPLFPLRSRSDNYRSLWETFLRNYNTDLSSNSCFGCSPNWAPNRRWHEEDDCYCVLDDSANPLLLPENLGIDTPLFLLIVRTLGDYYSTEDLPHPGGYRFLGLLLQPLEDLDQIRTKIMENPESRIPFVRIGFGAMGLSKENGEEALNRFKNQFVTIF